MPVAPDDKSDIDSHIRWVWLDTIPEEMMTQCNIATSVVGYVSLPLILIAYGV